MLGGMKTLESSASKFVVIERAAKMPSSCWGRYSYVAVIETDGRDYVAMISTRARGVRRIVRQYSPSPTKGRTERAAIVRERREAAVSAACLQRAHDRRLAAEAREWHRTEGA